MDWIGYTGSKWAGWMGEKNGSMSERREAWMIKEIKKILETG